MIQRWKKQTSYIVYPEERQRLLKIAESIDKRKLNANEKDFVQNTIDKIKKFGDNFMISPKGVHVAGADIGAKQVKYKITITATATIELECDSIEDARTKGCDVFVQPNNINLNSVIPETVFVDKIEEMSS